MPIAIDAETLHPSTRLALSGLEWLEERITPGNIVEIGCGNGMLSLVANHIWQAPTLACDISPNAVRDTEENIVQFAAGADIRVIRSDSFKHPLIEKSGPYSLIIANLLAQWQIGMAADMKDRLDTGGYILLSGILAWQAEGVLEAFKLLNINKLNSFSEQEWSCLVLKAD